MNTNFYYEPILKLSIDDFYSNQYRSFNPLSCYEFHIPKQYDDIAETLILEILKEKIDNDQYNESNNVVLASYKRYDNKRLIRYYNKHNPAEYLSNLPTQVIYREVPIFKLNDIYYIWKPKSVIYMYYISDYKSKK